MRTIACCDATFEETGMARDGVSRFRHYRQLLDEDLDVLFVCLWNDVAPAVTIAGLERGLHVFCEKPPGRTVQDIEEVREVEARHPNQKLKYGFNHRYHDSVRDALALIRSGNLGHLVDLNGTYGKSKMIRFDQDWRTKRAIAGGGILLDQGIHMVDMMRLFAGDFTEIHSHVSNRFWGHDVEDNAWAMMRTDDGVVAMLHSSATQWRHRFSLDITLSEGAISLSGMLSSSRSYGAETMTVIERSNDDRGDPREVATRYNADNSWRDEIAEFCRSILDGEPIRHGSSLEALKTMQLVYDIYRADATWAAQYGLGELPVRT
jgi:predicted dehydrogenase